jgi:hypothetical protein
MRNAVLWLAVAGLMAGAPGLAADAQVEAGRQCALVKDSLQRLVCYDRVFQVSTASVPPPAPRLAEPAAAPAIAVAPGAAAALGDEVVQRKERTGKPEEPASLEANITALKETRQDVVRMTLDNGQIWQQMDMSSVFQVTVGDTVRIEKGKMGGYRLVRVSRGRSGWVRVTRLR